VFFVGIVLVVVGLFEGLGVGCCLFVFAVAPGILVVLVGFLVWEGVFVSHSCI